MISTVMPNAEAQRYAEFAEKDHTTNNRLLVQRTQGYALHQKSINSLCVFGNFSANSAYLCVSALGLTVQIIYRRVRREVSQNVRPPAKLSAHNIV